MNHEEYIKSIKRQQSFIRRLFKKRERLSENIDSIVKDRYKDVIGKFFYVNSEDAIKSNRFSDGYYFVRGVATNSNFIGSSKVEIKLMLSCVGTTGHGDDTIGVEIVYINYFLTPEEDYADFIGERIVSKEEGLKEMRDACEKMIECYQQTIQ